MGERFIPAKVEGPPHKVDNNFIGKGKKEKYAFRRDRLRKLRYLKRIELSA